MAELKIKYDKLIVIKVTNSDGEVVKVNEHHHFTIGKVGDEISGGFYIKNGIPIPESITLNLPKID
jgi:hypothetical protein